MLLLSLPERRSSSARGAPMCAVCFTRMKIKAVLRAIQCCSLHPGSFSRGAHATARKYVIRTGGGENVKDYLEYFNCICIYIPVPSILVHSSFGVCIVQERDNYNIYIH